MWAAKYDIVQAIQLNFWFTVNLGSIKKKKGYVRPLWMCAMYKATPKEHNHYFLSYIKKLELFIKCPRHFY